MRVSFWTWWSCVALCLVTLGACVQTDALETDQKKFRLSWYGAAPFPLGVQSKAIDPNNTDFGGEGCLGSISETAAHSLMDLLRKGTPIGQDTDRTLSSMGTIVIIGPNGSFAGLINAHLGIDFDGNLFSIDSRTDYPEFEYEAFKLLLDEGCEVVRSTVETGPEYPRYR